MGCENRIWKLTIIIYARIALFENWVNLDFFFKILITWSVLTAPPPPPSLLGNQSGSHNRMSELEPAGSHKKVRTAQYWYNLAISKKVCCLGFFCLGFFESNLKKLCRNIEGCYRFSQLMLDHPVRDDHQWCCCRKNSLKDIAWVSLKVLAWPEEQ